MIKINLVPPEILAEEVKKRRLVQIGAGVAVGVLIFAGFSFMHYRKGVKLEQQHAELKEKYKKLEAIVKKVEAAESQARAVEARLKVMNNLDKARPFYPRFMTELLKHLVNGVWLNSLSVTGGQGKLKVSMSANALSIENVTEWLRTLGDSDSFSEPRLGALAFKADTVSFTMQAKYADPVLFPKKTGAKK